MNHFKGALLNQAFALALANHLVVVRDSITFKSRQLEIRLVDMTAVCIDANHANAIPLMMRVEDAIKFPAVLRFYPELAGFAEQMQARREALTGKRKDIPKWPNNVVLLNPLTETLGSLEDWATPWREDDSNDDHED